MTKKGNRKFRLWLFWRR